MAYAPIALIMPQYEDYPNYWLKSYEQGTVTPLSMATDATGSTTLAKSELDTQGFPLTAGSARFIPFINGDYDLWLFPTEAEADANDTTNAIQMADDLNADPANGLVSSSIAVTDADSMYDGTTVEEELAEVNSSVDSIAALKLIEPAAVTNNKKTMFVRGYYVPGDGGGGEFYWESASTDSDNGGRIIYVTAVSTG